MPTCMFKGRVGVSGWVWGTGVDGWMHGVSSMHKMFHDSDLPCHPRRRRRPRRPSLRP